MRQTQSENARIATNQYAILAPRSLREVKYAPQTQQKYDRHSIKGGAQYNMGAGSLRSSGSLVKLFAVTRWGGFYA